MSRSFRLQTVADTDYLNVYTNLSEDEFESFKEDPSEFEFDERITFLMEGNLRSAEITTDEDETLDVEPDDLWSNYIRPSDPDQYYDYDKDADDPVIKSKCETLVKRLESQYSCLEKLEPNTVTVLSKWHVYKEIDDFPIELGDDEELDTEKIQLIYDDYGKPRLPFPGCDSACDDVCSYLNDSDIEGKDLYWDIFPEDRYFATNLAYNYDLIQLEESEDCGADLNAYYAIRTNEEGKVISIEEFRI